MLGTIRLRVVDAVWPFLSVALFGARALLAILKGPPIHDAVFLTARLLLSSLPVVAVVAFASGAMLTVQAAASLSLIGGGPLSGTLVGLGGVREVFPLLAAASVAARSGAEFASALGAMKVSDQIDALDVMGLDPMRLLVAPRVLAAVIGTPIAVIFSDATGLLGSFLVGVFQLGIDRGSMWENLTMSVVVADLWVGIAKGLVLGFIIGVVSTWEGMRTTGGAKGVGLSTNRAVVRAMVSVSVCALFLTYLFYGSQVMK